MDTVIDIVTRLRNLTDARFSSYPVAAVIAEAADLIVFLRARNASLQSEIDRLREDIAQAEDA